MSETVFVYAEPRLRWGALSRHRPEAGLAFDKHVWLFPLRGRPGRASEALFERAGGIAIRDRRVRLADGRDLPMAAVVDASALPSLARVALAGPGVADLLRALLQGEDAVLHYPDAGPEFAHRLAGQLAAPEVVLPGLFRLAPDQARLAAAILAEEPRAYLLASPALPMPMQRLRSLMELSGQLSGGADAGALPFADFGALVTSCRWVATSLGSAQIPVLGIALYGGADLVQNVENAAAACGVSLRRLDDPPGPSTPAEPNLRQPLPLPRWDELPLPSTETIDAGGYNLAELPSSSAATALVLDDTAVVDLAPLRGWQQLAHVSLRGLRPISLAPLEATRKLQLGPVDPHTLPALAGFQGLEELRLDGTPLANPGLLVRCQALRSLELRHVPLETLRDIEALDGLTRLSIEATSAPSGLAHLAALPSLRELRIHVGQGFDLGQLPALPLLERLEVCGLDDRSIELENVQALARYPALRSLALRATSAATLAWLESLVHLTSLDLAATEVTDLSPLRSVPWLQQLDLTLVPATDVSPLTELSELHALHLSHVDAAIAPAALAAATRLEELHLRGCKQVHGLRELARLAHLRVLDLSQTPLAQLDVVAHLPFLESLNISRTEVEDVTALAALTVLRRLMLVGCRISDIGTLTRSRALDELSLEGTRVSDLAPLAECSALSKLSLAGLAIADLGPIAALPRLRSLDASRTRVTALPPLARLHELRTLDLSGTALSSLEPLRGLERLRELHAHHLARPVDFAPLLDLPPLALLEIARTGLAPELEARLATRHHLVLASE